MAKLAILPQTASVQEIQRNYRKLLDRVKATKNPLFILRNNAPEAVVIDVESWHKIAAQINKAQEEADTRAAIAAYQKAKKSGKLKTLTGSLADLIEG